MIEAKVRLESVHSPIRREILGRAAQQHPAFRSRSGELTVTFLRRNPTEYSELPGAPGTPVRILFAVVGSPNLTKEDCARGSHEFLLDR